MNKQGLLLLLQCLMCLCLVTLTSSAFAKHSQYVLIYSGINSCDGCPEAIADVAKQAHLPVKYVSDPKKIPALLSKAAIFAIGGTEDDIEQMRLAFNKTIVTSIQNYVSKGGRYLGICGGGFIAATHYMAEEDLKVEGFNILPALAEDYSDTSKAHLELVQWQGKDALLYFQGGPKFILDNNAKDINIIAKYRNGDIAALEYLYGLGKVVVIGPHPEADKTWLEEDGINASHWQPRQDLLVALIKSMMED